MPPTIVLPYASVGPKRERAFTCEMEKAAILCLAEARRRKPRFLWGTSEEVEYIARFHYPLWGVPWEDRCIIVDGLGFSSVTISYGEMPNIEAFIEDLERSSVSSRLFEEALEKHEQAFKGFASATEDVIEAVAGEGLVLEFLSDIVRSTGLVKEASEDGIVLVPGSSSREEAEKKAETFVRKWLTLRTEAQAFNYVLSSLEEEMEHHKDKTSMEIEQIWADYENRIAETKGLVDKSIRELTREKERETEQAVGLQERRLKKLVREQESLQRKIEKLKLFLRETEGKRKDQKRRYPKRSTARLDSRIESCRERIEDLSEKVRDSSRLQIEVGKDGEEVLKTIEERYLGMATKEIEKLELLEDSRDLEMSEKNEHVRKLEEKVSVIEAQVKQLIEHKNGGMREFQEKTLPWKIEETTLVGIPFYLVQYRAGRRTRVDIHPPVTAASYDGIVKKIQRTILSFSLEARIQLLLSPRSTALSEGIFANLRRSLETNAALREEVSLVGKSRNLLEVPSFKEEATRGMNELEAEGWINTKEKDSILRIYAR